MDTPIYNATKQSFDVIETKITYINTQIDTTVAESINSAKKYTKEEIAELKSFFAKQIDSLKELITKQTTEQNAKLSALSEKLEPLKTALSALISPPSLDTIVDWAKSATKLYTMQYEEVVAKATDILKTTSYMTTEVPKLIVQVSRLPDVLDKLNTIPVEAETHLDQ